MFLYLYRQSVEMVDFSNLVSSVVTKTGMRVVWAWIPERFALFSPIRLFNTEEHGRSLYSYVTFLDSFLIPLGKCLLVRQQNCCHFLGIDDRNSSFSLSLNAFANEISMLITAKLNLPIYSCNRRLSVFTVNGFVLTVYVLVWSPQIALNGKPLC